MSNACLINSLIPEIKINSVTLSTLGSDELLFVSGSGTFSLDAPELATTRISVNTSLQERISQSSTAWYRQGNILQFLRYRVLVCLGDRNPSNLDFITQRFNEYHQLSGTFIVDGNETNITTDKYYDFAVFSQMMRIRTDLNGQEYISPDGYDLLSDRTNVFTYRPYQTTDPTNYLGRERVPGEKPGFYTYAAMAEAGNPIAPKLAEIVLYDKPLSEILPRDSSGEIIKRDIVETLPASQNRRETKVVFEEVPLPEFSFDIGSLTNVSYKSSEINHLSVYGFVYVDYKAFLEAYNFLPDNTTRRITLLTGVGKNTSATLIGDKFIFEPNTPQDFKKPKIPIDIIDSPDVQLLRDLRRQTLDPSVFSLYQQDLSNLAYINFDGSLLDQDDTGKTLHKDNYFTDFWCSKDPSGRLEYLYGFNLAKFLAQNSQFPKLFSNTVTADFLIKRGVEILKENSRDLTPYRTMIKDVRTGRRVINPDAFSNSNDLGTNTKTKILGPSEEYPESYIPNPDRIQDISLSDELYETYFYQGIDNFEADREYQDRSLIEADKKYQYFSEVLVVDTSKLLLIKAVSDLNNAANNLTKLFNYISDPVYGFFDSRTQKFTTPLMAIEYLGGTALDYATLQINIYKRYLELFQIQTRIPRVSEYVLGFVDSLDPLLYQQAEKIIEKFASDIAAVANVFHTVQLGEQKEGYKEKTILRLNNLHEQEFPILTYRNYFSEIVPHGAKNEIGYEYMSGFRKEFGIKTLSKGFYLDRIQREISKYFYLPSTQDPAYLEQYPNISRNSELYDFFPYVESSYRHFTPARIFSQERTKNNNSLKPFVQLVEDFNNNEYFKPDIDGYASLFAGLIKSKNNTEYLELVGYENEPELEEDNPNRQLYNSLLSSLGDDLACEIGLQPVVQQPRYEPSSYANENDYYEDEDDAERDLGRGAALFTGAPNPESIIGGIGDQSDLTQQFLRDVENTFRQIDDAEENNKKNKKQEIKGGEKTPLLPIKFVFGILGELQLDPGNDNVSYQQVLFNSTPAINQILGITEGSLIRDLLNDYSSLPNQVKASLIMSLKPNELVLGPMATRRFLSQDHDPVSEISNTIYHYDTRATVQAINPPFTPLYDPMKIYSKFLAFWMNFKQIIKIQVLTGFGRTNAPVPGFADVVLNQNSLALPQWQDLNKEIFDNFQENGEFLLCRITPLSYDEMIPVENQDNEDNQTGAVQPQTGPITSVQTAPDGSVQPQIGSITSVQSAQTQGVQLQRNLSNLTQVGSDSAVEQNAETENQSTELSLKQYFKNTDLLDLPIYNKYFFIRASK